MEKDLSQGVICPNNWDGLLLLNAVSSHQLLKLFHIKLALHAALLPGDFSAFKGGLYVETLRQIQFLYCTYSNYW